MEALKNGSDVLFVLIGAVMVLAMHSGFAFLELGTVRAKNQVNALVKILTDFSASTVAYFVIGYGMAYGVSFFVGAEQLAHKSGYELVKFFFLLTFAAAVPAIVSGGIAERAKFYPQLVASFVIVALVYPLFEGIAWNQKFGVQAWLKASLGEEFHDFAGSVVVHAMGGWIALLLARELKSRATAGAAPAAALAGMVLIAPAVDFTEELMWKQFPDSTKREIEQKGVWMRPSEYGNDPYPITRGLIEDGRKHLLLGGLIETRCPVHILQGVQDPDVPWRHAVELVSRFSRDDIVITLIKDGDHRLSRPEDIERLIAAIKEF